MNNDDQRGSIIEKVSQRNCKHYSLRNWWWIHNDTSAIDEDEDAEANDDDDDLQKGWWKFYSSSGLEAHLLICSLPPTSSNPDFKSYIFGEPTNLSPQSNWFLEIFLNIFLKRSKSPTFCSVRIGCHPLELSTKFVLNISNVFHFHILRLISIPTISQIQIFYFFIKGFSWFQCL